MEAADSVFVVPEPELPAALAWCRARLRDLAAAVLLAVTVAAAVAPPDQPATTASHASAPADTSTAGGSGVSAYYSLAPLPRPAGGPIPLGRGMWLHKYKRTEGGDPNAIVARAKAYGLTHLYVRVGSSWDGFYAQSVLDDLLPVAHQAGLKVVGWDFPKLEDVLGDADRARAAIWYATPSGHRIDAFSADIETPAEGTRLSAGAVEAYGRTVRASVGDDFPLIATVPRPNGTGFPYESLGAFDAIAPMVYWGTRDPANDVARAIERLSAYGKPVLPVGQAYDMAVDGGPAGAPSKADIARFIESATDRGALGVSFWVWDHATPEQWQAIAEAGHHFDLAAASSPQARPAQVTYLQRVLTGLGHPAPVSGRLDSSTVAAVASVQRAAGLPATGVVDTPTVQALLGPVNLPGGSPPKAGR